MPFSALNLVRPAAQANTASSPIAIDFGASSLKVLQVANSDPPALVAAASLANPDEVLFDSAKRLAFQAQELPGLIKGTNFKGKRAVCSIPSAHLFCKHMQIQKTDKCDLGTAVRAAVSNQLNCHVDSLLYRHVEVAGIADQASGGKAEVICLAVSRKLITRLMESLRAARLEPVGIQPACIAVLRAFDPMTRREADQDLTTLYLDLGASTTNVLVAHGRDLVFAKTILQGGTHFDEHIATTSKCGLAWARTQRLAAEELTSSPNDADGSPQSVDLRVPIETLTEEVAGCIRYHGSLFPSRRISRAIFVGGEARHRPLCQAIAKSLRLPAQVADPMARVARTGHEPCRGMELSTSQPGWAAALGLALCPTDL